MVNILKDYNYIYKTINVNYTFFKIFIGPGIVPIILVLLISFGLEVSEAYINHKALASGFLSTQTIITSLLVLVLTITLTSIVSGNELGTVADTDITFHEFILVNTEYNLMLLVISFIFQLIYIVASNLSCISASLIFLLFHICIFFILLTLINIFRDMTMVCKKVRNGNNLNKTKFINTENEKLKKTLDSNKNLE